MLMALVGNQMIIDIKPHPGRWKREKQTYTRVWFTSLFTKTFPPHLGEFMAFQ